MEEILLVYRVAIELVVLQINVPTVIATNIGLLNATDINEW